MATLDASAIDVTMRRSVGARLAPASATRVGTGVLDVDLSISNTGNACDERYVVDVTSSPAGLVTTVSPARFLVPAGQVAAIRVRAEASVLGIYDLQVTVMSDVSNPACPALPAATAAVAGVLSFVDGGTTSTTTSTTGTIPTTTSTTTTTGTSTTASTTTSTLPALDHFLLYKVARAAGAEPFASFAPLALQDGFGRAEYRVGRPRQLGVPADMNGAGVGDAVTHLVDHEVKPMPGTPSFHRVRDVEVSNSCSALRLELSKPSALLAPAHVSLLAPPASPQIGEHEVDHYLCYKAAPQKKLADGTPLPKLPNGMQVEVSDQFQTRRYDLKKVTRLCVPVDASGAPVVVSGPDKGIPVPVTAAPIRHAAAHLMCYRVKLATRSIAQAGCAPIIPGDRGVGIVPKQPKHVTRDPIHATSTLQAIDVASRREAELCIPSSVGGARP